MRVGGPSLASHALSDWLAVDPFHHRCLCQAGWLYLFAAPGAEGSATMFRRLFTRGRTPKTLLVPPQDLATWIERKVQAQVPRTHIYQQLLDMQRHADNPILYQVAAKDVMAIMLMRNHRGTMLELAGQIAAAIEYYEANVRDGYGELYPYYRLRLLYEQCGDYKNALQVCEAYLCLLERQSDLHKAAFTTACQQFKIKLEQQERAACLE
jgi:hypothetical protein